MPDQNQIQGLPPGAIVGAPLQSAPQVQGLPPGAIVGPAMGATSEADAIAQLPNAAQQAAQSIQKPMQGSTIGGIYHALNEGNSSVNPKVVAAQDLNNNMQRGLDEAAQGKLTTAGVALGAVKGGAEAAHTAGRIINAATGDTVSALPTSFKEPESLAASNHSEMIGKIGEGVLEFFLGDAAIKELSIGQKLAEYAKLSKLAESYPAIAQQMNKVASIVKAGGVIQKGMNITGNAARVGALSAAQAKLHGQSNEEALTAAEYGAVGTAALEGTASVLRPVVQKAFKALNLPEDAAIAKKAAADAKASSEFTDAIRQNYLDDADSLAKTPNPQATLTGQELVTALQKDLDDVHEQLTTNYGRKLDQFAAQAEKAGIKVGGPDSALASTAKEILGEGSSLPSGVQDALKGVTPSLERAKPLLEQLAKGEPMSWAEATELQKTLGAKAYAISDYADPLKQVLNNLKSAVGESLEQAATDGGQPNIARDLKVLRADYADTISSLQENSVIRAIRNKDLDGVAKILMSRNTIGDNVETLRGLLDRVGSKNMESVENEMFNQLIDKSSDVTSGSRKIDPDKFAAQFFKIPAEVRNQIWGSKLDAFKFALKALQKVSFDAEEHAGLAVQRAEAAKEAANQAQKLFPGLAVRHGGAGTLVAKAIWDTSNGDYDKAQKDIAGALAFEGGSFVFKNRAAQNAVLTILNFVSRASENVNPIRLESGAAREVTAGTLAPTGFGTGPELPGMKGNPEAEAANAAKTGLPESTSVKPDEELTAAGVRKSQIPKEQSTGNPDFDNLIKDAGGIPSGIQKGNQAIGLPELVMVSDPVTGSTAAIPREQVTPDSIQKTLDELREPYRRSGQLPPKTVGELVEGQKARPTEKFPEMKSESQRQNDLRFESALSKEAGRQQQAKIADIARKPLLDRDVLDAGVLPQGTMGRFNRFSSPITGGSFSVPTADLTPETLDAAHNQHITEVGDLNKLSPTVLEKTEHVAEEMVKRSKELAVESINDAGLKNLGEVTKGRGLFKIESPLAPGYTSLVRHADLLSPVELQQKMADTLDTYATQPGWNVAGNPMNPSELKQAASKLRQQAQDALDKEAQESRAAARQRDQRSGNPEARQQFGGGKNTKGLSDRPEPPTHRYNPDTKKIEAIDLTDELAKANAVEPAPSNPESKKKSPTLNPRAEGVRSNKFGEALEAAKKSGTPLERSAINKMLEDEGVNERPSSILDLKPDKYGPTVAKAIRNLQAARLYDIGQGNPELAKILRSVLEQ